VTRIVIDGADSLPPRGGVQLSATAVLADGTSRVVTDEATWESSNGSLLAVSSRGMVSAGDQRGEGEIRVTYLGPLAGSSGVRASRRQFVLPAGTWALYGSVKDGGVPLSGVELEVTAGLGTGLTVTADPNFHLYGVGGDVEIRASKAGYDTETRRILVTGHQTIELDLRPSSARPIVAGTYALSIVAAPECRDRLPEAARARAYTAVVSQNGAQLEVVLSGAQLGSAYGPSNSFTGSVELGRTPFYLSAYSGNTTATFSPPSVLELLTSPNTYFTFFGSVVTTANELGYTGSLDGSVEVLTVLGSPWDYGDAYSRVALCRSTGHQFTLRRVAGGH